MPGALGPLPNRESRSEWTLATLSGVRVLVEIWKPLPPTLLLASFWTWASG